uniref:ATP-dependent Clp protease proteolytic subunit n=1 Tax=Juniperus procumbens TaxID=720871 RepID=UPI0021142B65|nr:ATP-dependent Clp protease proteolytic subunit [Juniperus procumbens]USN89891.1 ATP-dependent Clp protease proteolytic subunit [Juniperus procumbens]
MWVELYYRLFFGRYLFLGRALEKQPADQIMKCMIYLNQEDQTKDFMFFISCRGGGMLQGVAVYDVMHFVTGDVFTAGFGLNASMGAFLLHGGALTKRVLSENGRMMIHQPHMSPYDRRRHDESGSDAEFMGLLRTYILETYIRRTRQEPELIESLLERDIFLEPGDARDVFLIDEIGGEGLGLFFPNLWSFDNKDKDHQKGSDNDDIYHHDNNDIYNHIYQIGQDNDSSENHDEIGHDDDYKIGHDDYEIGHDDDHEIGHGKDPKDSEYPTRPSWPEQPLSPQKLVMGFGAEGFEPTTSTIPKWHATKLRHTPL